MPTYIVSAVAGRLSQDAKQTLAASITRSHSFATGAQGFFAQVIFNEVASGNYFIGGRPLKSDQIFVHGYIRAGRTPQQKEQLLNDILKAVMDAGATESRYVWAYLSEMPPSQMVEYGKVLPDPGMESQWLESMSVADREYLLNIG